MAANTKVYDFNYAQVQEQVRQILARSPGNEANVADLISRSGLPKHQVESVLPAVVEDCRGQLKVTESGDILYYFPKGLASQSKGPGVWLRKAASFLAKAGKFLFKAWIMVMLVGYFALFVALLILAVLASIAIKTAGKGDRDNDSGGSFLGGYMMMRLLDLLITFWIWREPREDRRWGRDGKPGKKNNRAFYKSVFAFVFGEENLEAAWAEKEKKAVISFIQSRKGLVSLEEIMAQTGRDRESASAYVSRLLLEFQGEPQVSDQGTLYYSFPELLKTTRASGEAPLLPPRPAIPFNNNNPGTNRWIGFFNGFNLAFGGYFLFFSLVGTAGTGFGFLYAFTALVLTELAGLSAAAAAGTLALGLGAVPAVFSLLFYLIPVFRRWREKARNAKISQDNLRRSVVEKMLAQPLDLRLSPVEEKILPETVGTSDVQVVQGPVGFSYRLKDVDREVKDLQNLRSRVRTADYHPGKVVFDSGN